MQKESSFVSIYLLCSIIFTIFGLLVKNTNSKDNFSILVAYCSVATTHPTLLFYIKYILGWQYTILRMIIPFCSLLICNCAIIYKLLKERKVRKHLDSAAEHSDSLRSLIVMLLTVSFFCLVSIAPMRIMITIFGSPPIGWKIQKQWQAKALFHFSFAVLLINANHSINFILYLISGQQFRNAIKDMMTKTFCDRA